MRKTASSHDRSLRVKNNSMASTSQSFRASSKGFVTTDSKFFISKYSMFKDTYDQKHLANKLESHGPSLIYNFKYRNIMKPCFNDQSDWESSRLPNISTSDSPTNKINDNKILIFGDSQALSPTNAPPKSHTNQLKLRILKFLKPHEEGECKKTLENFETEISSFKEKHRQQRDHIYRVLKTSEVELLQEKVASLAFENIRKGISRNRNIEARKDLSPPESPILRNSQSTKSFTKQLTLNTKFKRAATNLTIETSPLHRTTVTQHTSKTASFSCRVGSVTRAQQRFSKKMETAKENNSIDANSLSPSKLNQLLEQSKKALDIRLSSYRPRPKTPKDDFTLSTGVTNSPSIKKRFLFQKAIFNYISPARKKFIDTVQKIVKKLDLLGLTARQIYEDKIFPSGPYERPRSEELIKHTKLGDYHMVKLYLKDNKYLVFDYDPIKQTAVHWAAKRGYSRILKLLLEYGADPDARDLSGRTPLFFAARGGFLICVKLLLSYRANPLIKSTSNMMAMDFAKQDNIRYLIRKSYRNQLILSLCSPKRYKQVWEEIDKKDLEVREAELE